MLGKTRDEAMDNPKDSENLDLAAETARSKKRASQVVVFSISRSNTINIHKKHGNNNGGGVSSETYLKSRV